MAVSDHDVAPGLRATGTSYIQVPCVRGRDRLMAATRNCPVADMKTA